MRKIRFLFAIVISLMPMSGIRIFLYRHILKYKINSSKIGFGTILDIEACDMDGTLIGNFNLFTGPFSLTIKEGTSIGSGNVFRCGKWVTDTNATHINFLHTMHIGKAVTITNKHYFDLAGLIDIGDGSWVAGYASQFWTHGGEKSDNDIIIGKNCYLGSAVRFAPGSMLANNSLVGMGSVVTKKFKKENIMIAGAPAVMKKENFDWQKDL
ncbi:MAG: hypothetical protein L3J43_02545 [Sulfurovum sp.]|nr:hypothetical protein [Sulfurovum sp.]